MYRISQKTVANTYKQLTSNQLKNSGRSIYSHVIDQPSVSSIPVNKLVTSGLVEKIRTIHHDSYNDRHRDVYAYLKFKRCLENVTKISDYITDKPELSEVLDNDEKKLLSDVYYLYVLEMNKSLPIVNSQKNKDEFIKIIDSMSGYLDKSLLLKPDNTAALNFKKELIYNYPDFNYILDEKYFKKG